MPLAWVKPASGRQIPGGLSLAILTCAITAGTCAEPTDYPGKTDSSERHVSTQAFLNQKLWLWQKRLRLQDWNVSIKLARTAELRPKTLGNINWDRRDKSAVISVMDPDDYKFNGNAMLDDMEMTIVHELVHLHLSGLPRNDDTKKVEEQAVNLLAEALIKLDRKDPEAGEEPTHRARQQTAVTTVAAGQ
jgi:hypothetical protein